MREVLFHHLREISFLMFFLPLLTSSVSLKKLQTKEICESKECKTAAQGLRGVMNFDADPCDDFYEYVCGKWKTNGVISDQFTLKALINEFVILEFIMKNNRDDEPQAVHKARQLFSLCLKDTDPHHWSTQFNDILSKILVRNENNQLDYTTAFARAARIIGYKMFFDLNVTPNPYNTTMNMIILSKPKPHTIVLDREIEGKDGKPTPYFLEQYTLKIINENCQEMDVLNCVNFIRNLSSIEKITMLRKHEIIKMLKAENDEIVVSNINTLQQLQEMSDTIAMESNSSIPKFNWTRYIEEMFSNLENVVLNLQDPRIQIYINNLDYITSTIEKIYKNSLEMIEAQISESVRIYLSKYSDSNNNVHSSRETQCIESIESSFSLAISYLYTERENYEELKADVHEIYDLVQSSFSSIIQQSSWIEEKTKERSLKKLKNFIPLIAYPDMEEYLQLLNKSYGKINITENFLETMISINQYKLEEQLKKLNTVNDLNEKRWTDFSFIDVNAYHFHTSKTVAVPVSILGPPFYTHSLKALDFGLIGCIIGHELTHGFDNNGILFNEDGNIEDWWDKKSKKKYDNKMKCLVRSYEKYKVNGTIGTSTISDDIADNGGFHEALLAYRIYEMKNGKEPLLPHFENFTHEQLFTLGYANNWCADAKYASYFNPSNDHSSNKARVNEICRNSDEFSAIWNCPRGSKMNPKKKCSIW